MACANKVLHADEEISCVEKAIEDTTHVVSAMSCVDDKALEEDSHVVPENRTTVMPKKEEQRKSHEIQNKTKMITPEMIKRKKIFVGGLPSGISEEDFKSYFERFGTITDVVVMQDSVTHRPRGFGFVTFDSEKSVEDVMLNSFHDLNGKQVEVKRVMSKEEKRNNIGAFDHQLRHNNAKGTSLESFPYYYYYGTNLIPTPWYNNNNGLYATASSSNPYGWYPMVGASFPCYMPMVVPMTRPSTPQPFDYCFPSYYSYVGGNVGGES